VKEDFEERKGTKEAKPQFRSRTELARRQENDSKLIEPRKIIQAKMERNASRTRKNEQGKASSEEFWRTR